MRDDQAYHALRKEAQVLLHHHSLSTTTPYKPNSSPEFGEPVEAMAPATCGELMQGTIDGVDFLVNSPISMHSKVKVQLNRIGGVCVFSKGIYSKTACAISSTLAKFDAAHLGADFEVQTTIPRGKGLASSTSEIGAAIHATAKAIGQSLSPADMADIAVSCDTSDGVYFPGISRCNPVSGELIEVLGEPPPLAFIVVDTGGFIESMDCDRDRLRRHAQRNESGLKDALKLIRKGFQSSSPRLIAAGATISASINQSISSKPLFKELLLSTKEVGSLGLNCAHTGTVLGVMFDPRTTDQEQLLKVVEREAGEKHVIGCYRLISGGAQ